MIQRLLPSITIRLTLAFAVATSVVVGIGATELYLRVRDAQDRIAASSLTLRWEDLRETARHSSNATTTADRARTIIELGDGPTAAFDPRTHERLAATGRAAKLGLELTSRGRHHYVHGATPYDTYVGVPAAGWPVAVLAVDRRSDDDQRERLLGQIVVGSMLVVLLVSLIAFWLARRALAPVELLRGRARQLADADQPGLLPVPPGNDEITRLAETLNDLLERRHAAIEHERAFVADAGHELRTPLATLLAELELALERERTPDEYRATIDVARREAERLAHLARQLLLLGAQAPQARPTRLAALDVLRDTAARVRRARVASVEIHVEGDEDAWIDADRMLFEVALTNLLDNAVRHAASRVDATARIVGDEVHVLVVDDGAGFTPELRVRAFERFTRGADERAHAGSGLGLAIVDAIVTAHDWRADNVDPPGGSDGGGAVELVMPRAARG
jgi:signal transduction histidine kinase